MSEITESAGYAIKRRQCIESAGRRCIQQIVCTTIFSILVSRQWICLPSTSFSSDQAPTRDLDIDSTHVAVYSLDPNFSGDSARLLHYMIDAVVRMA